MPIEQYVNDPGTTLNGAINNSQTSLVVASSTGYPSGGNFRILIEAEIMIVTAVSGTTWTVTRGAEGTTAASHADTTAINHILTAGGLNGIRGTLSQMGTYANLPTSLMVAGDRYKQTDGPYEFIFDGTNWIPFYGPFQCVLPNGGAYTWLNQGSSTMTATSGYLDLHAIGASGANLITLYKAQPATPYTLDVLCSWNFIGNTGQASAVGVGFYDSSNGRLETLHNVYNSGNQASNYYQVNQWNSTTSFRNNPMTGDSGPDRLMHFRLTNDGTTIAFYVGDGFTWYNCYSEAVGTVLTPDNILFFADAEGGSSTIFDANLYSWYEH